MKEIIARGLMRMGGKCTEQSSVKMTEKVICLPPVGPPKVFFLIAFSASLRVTPEGRAASPPPSVGTPPAIWGLCTVVSMLTELWSLGISSKQEEKHSTQQCIKHTLSLNDFSDFGNCLFYPAQYWQGITSHMHNLYDYTHKCLWMSGKMLILRMHTYLTMRIICKYPRFLWHNL